MIVATGKERQLLPGSACAPSQREVSCRSGRLHRVLSLGQLAWLTSRLTGRLVRVARAHRERGGQVADEGSRPGQLFSLAFESGCPVHTRQQTDRLVAKHQDSQQGQDKK